MSDRPADSTIPADSSVTKDQDYWHQRHPRVVQLYKGRPLPGKKDMFDMDVRNFMWPDDAILKKCLMDNDLIVEGDADKTMHKIQDYVCRRITYTGDARLGVPEYWFFPVETLTLRRADCEDGALLIASLGMNALPVEDHWRIRVAAGWVRPSPTAPQGGHGYCTWCRKTDNEWVALDWCYAQDPKVAVADKPLIKDNSEYEDVWFSFNHMHAYSHASFDMQGRVKN